MQLWIITFFRLLIHLQQFPHILPQIFKAFDYEGLMCLAFLGTRLQIPGVKCEMDRNDGWGICGFHQLNLVLISDSTKKEKLTMHLWVGLYRDTTALSSPETGVRKCCKDTRGNMWDRMILFYIFSDKTEDWGHHQRISSHCIISYHLFLPSYFHRLFWCILLN